MVSFSKSSQEGSSRNAVEEPTGRHDNVIFSSQEGSSRNAVEEPTGRDDKVTFSQKGSSRNAVEESPDRVDTQRSTGRSNLQDEKPIVLKRFSRRGLSCIAVEQSTGRDRKNKMLSHLSNRISFFGVHKGFQERHSKFRVFFSMLLIFLIEGSLGCTFMTEAQADQLTEVTLKRRLSANSRCLSKNNRDFSKVIPSATELTNAVENVLQLKGFYKKLHRHQKELTKPGRNEMARACIRANDAQDRLKFNYARFDISDNDYNFPGYSAAMYNEDVTIRSITLEAKLYYILTVLQGKTHYIIIPFVGKAERSKSKNSSFTHLRIYSSYHLHSHDYIKMEFNQEDRVLRLLEKDMNRSWAMEQGKLAKPNRWWYRAPPASAPSPAHDLRYKHAGHLGNYGSYHPAQAHCGRIHRHCSSAAGSACYKRNYPRRNSPRQRQHGGRAMQRRHHRCVDSAAAQAAQRPLHKADDQRDAEHWHNFMEKMRQSPQPSSTKRHGSRNHSSAPFTWRNSEGRNVFEFFAFTGREEKAKSEDPSS